MIDLDRPRDQDTHTIADFAELLCLLTVDRQISRDLITDHIFDSTNNDSGKGRHILADERLDDCFSHLQWRRNAFEGVYPFTLDPHNRVLSAPEELSKGQMLYALLLLCGNLPFIKRAFYKGFTDSFERIAKASLRRIWPSRGIVKAFGKNEAEYIGEKWERMNQLGRDIGGQPTCTAKTFRQQDVGDGGVDLVAWLPLDSNEAWNIPSALGQCACSRDEWPKKQSEISNGRLGFHLNPTHPWMEMIFIPQCFRDNRGRWAVAGDLGKTIIVDRLRILSHLDPEEDWELISPPESLREFLVARLELV